MNDDQMKSTGTLIKKSIPRYSLPQAAELLGMPVEQIILLAINKKVDLAFRVKETRYIYRKNPDGTVAENRIQGCAHLCKEDLKDLHLTAETTTTNAIVDGKKWRFGRIPKIKKGDQSTPLRQRPKVRLKRSELLVETECLEKLKQLKTSIPKTKEGIPPQEHKELRNSNVLIHALINMYVEAKGDSNLKLAGQLNFLKIAERVEAWLQDKGCDNYGEGSATIKKKYDRGKEILESKKKVPAPS